MPTPAARTKLIASLNSEGINAVFHYVPLHSSPAGRRFGRTCGDLTITNDMSQRLVRLPLWVGLEHHIDWVIDVTRSLIRKLQ